ncbi:MAG: hypothetical protein ACLQLC_21660 [Candidatus Sulfotelmatobacter sp.]
MPIEKLENGTWLHASRLPLGYGWSGHCTAPGHEGDFPSQDELHEFCNLGYAEGCGRLPRERLWDSIRFGARFVGGGMENPKSGRVQITYVCERGYLPAEHGVLEFDAADFQCQRPHRDGRVQRMAQCFLRAFLEKRKRQEVPEAVAG